MAYRSERVLTWRCELWPGATAFDMIVLERIVMDRRVLDAYVDHVREQAERGVLDCSLTDKEDESKSIEEHMVETLRAAGKLPAGFEDAERAARRTA
jgi:hypothetical protein